MMNPRYSVSAVFSAGPQGGPLLFTNPAPPPQNIQPALAAFYKGDPGLPGDAAQISAAPGNILTLGPDQKLMVPGGDFDYEALVATNLPL